MFFAAGVGAYQAAMFHLFTHAFFKALLFLGAGSVIHGMHHEQDMRKHGRRCGSCLPITYAVMTIGTLAITGLGIPGVELGFAGFYSKDAIIESAYAAARAAIGGGLLRLRRRHPRGRPDRLLLLAPGVHDLQRHSQRGSTRTRPSRHARRPRLARPARDPRRAAGATTMRTTTTATATTTSRTRARWVDAASRCSCCRSARSLAGFVFAPAVRRRRAGASSGAARSSTAPANHVLARAPRRPDLGAAGRRWS